MIISPNMLKTIEKSKELFIKKYIDKIPEIQLLQTFRKGKEIHALANYYLKGQDILKLEKALDEEKKKIWEKLKNSEYFKYDFVNCEYSINAKLDEFWLGGRIDAVVKNKENYYILDYKTGHIPQNPEYDYQTMVYLYCMDKILKNYDSLNFIYIGLKDYTERKIIFNDKYKKEYKNLLLKGCLQIKSLL